MLISNEQQLNEMTVREIAHEARIVIGTHEYFEAKKLLEPHVRIANEKMKLFCKEINKKLGTHKSPTQIRVITDFKRFK